MKLNSITSRLHRLRRLLLAAGVLLWLVMAFSMAFQKSYNVDEVPHLAAGLTILGLHDFRVNPEHPPLVKILGAIPGYLLAPPDYFRKSEGEHAVQEVKVFWENEPGIYYAQYLLMYSDEVATEYRLFLARIVPIFIGLTGGVFAWFWAREFLSASAASAIAAGALLFYPEYHGHAIYLTFDVPLLVACAGASLAAMHWWKKPNWKRAFLFAVACGIASLVKLPASLFVVAMLLTLIGLSFFTGGRIRTRTVLLLCVLTFGTGVFAAWAGAGFRFSALAEGTTMAHHHRYLPPVEHPRGAADEVANFLWHYHLLPESSISTLVQLGVLKKRPYYLLGQWSTHGFYSYFLVTFLLKTPLAMMALLGIAIWNGAKGRKKRSAAAAWRMQKWLILWCPFLVILVITMLLRANMGHRYILFIYFPIAVTIGAGAASLLRRGKHWRFAVGGLLAFLAVSALTAYPHGATYFNLIGGSPERARAWLRDSNVDWGQDGFLLQRFIRDNEIQGVNLSLMGAIRPEELGIENYRWLDTTRRILLMPEERITSHPNPQWPTVISVNEVDNMRQLYPGRYERPADFALNSLLVYLPQEGTAAP